MSKMSELSQVLDDMITCGEGLIKAANALREIFSESRNDTPSVPQAVPEAPAPAKENCVEKTYTFAEVRKAFSAKSHEGYTAQIKALIGKYGAERLSDIKEENYPALMADLEVIG